MDSYFSFSKIEKFRSRTLEKTVHFLTCSSKNKVNRSKQTINHACGSRSLVARAHESMEKNDGQLDFPGFFKDTHYNPKKKKWSTPACETIHNEMINDLETQSSQADPVALTPEEMSTRYLGQRSGVLKGIGMRPSSSLRSTATSGSERKLQEKVDEQQQRMEEQQRQLEEQRRQLQEQQQRMDMMFTWMSSKGYCPPGQGPHPPPPPPPDGSAGCGLAA